MCVCVCVCVCGGGLGEGVIEPSDIHLSFRLGLRPMLRPIIAYEEDSGDHGNSGNRVKDNSILG